MASDYGNPSYWDERYSKHFDADDQAVFDWYVGYEQLKPHMAPYMSNDPDFEVLIPGCGNSSLGAEMYDDGYVQQLIEHNEGAMEEDVLIGAWLPKLGYRSHDTVPKNEHTTFVNIITKDMVKDGYLRSRKKQGSGETEFVLGARSLHTKDANAEKEFVQGRVMEQAGASQVTQSQA